MSDRVSGRVESRDEDDLLTAHAGGAPRDDYTAQPIAAPRRLTPGQLDHIALTLTDVDRAVIDVLSVVRMASGSQLNRLLWPTTASGARSARRHLKRLTDLRVLARLHRRVGGVKSGSQGYTYALDTTGQRLAQSRHTRTIRRPTPSDAFVDHTLGVTEIYVCLREAAVVGRIEVGSFAAEPDCWRRFTGRGGRPVTLKPDAYTEWLTPDWELLAFFEVDRATEHPGRIANKAAQYVRYWRTGDEQRVSGGVFPSVVWIAPDDTRAAVLRRVIESVEGATDMSVVITGDQLPGFIGNTPREEVNP